MARTTTTKTTKATPAKTAPKKASTREPKTAPAASTTQAPDLFALLLQELASRGVTPEVRQAPNTGYASLLIGKSNIAYVYRQTRTGLRVAPAATTDDLNAAAKKVFEPRKERSARFAIVTVAEDAKALPVIADVLKGSAERLAPAK